MFFQRQILTRPTSIFMYILEKNNLYEGLHVKGLHVKGKNLGVISLNFSLSPCPLVSLSHTPLPISPHLLCLYRA